MDHSIFVSDEGIALGIYIDDLLVVAPTIDALDGFKIKLSQRFRIKDLGPVAYYLGM